MRIRDLAADAQALQAHHSPRRHALLPEDFARTGLAVHCNGTPPRRFQVLGERSSGTNFVKRLLTRNSTMEPTEALGWKHGHPSALAIPADFAVICVVRNAADWARSMHAKPWHATPALQAMDFADFLRAPWDTSIDRARYFDNQIDLVGQPLQADRDPVTGRLHGNLFALRRAKLAGLLSYFERGCTCAMIRTEAVQNSPETMVERLVAGLGLPPCSTPFRGVTRRLGAKFKPAVAGRPATPAGLSTEDREFMKSELDVAVEARLGYTY